MKPATLQHRIACFTSGFAIIGAFIAGIAVAAALLTTLYMGWDTVKPTVTAVFDSNSPVWDMLTTALSYMAALLSMAVLLGILAVGIGHFTVCALVVLPPLALTYVLSGGNWLASVYANAVLLWVMTACGALFSFVHFVRFIGSYVHVQKYRYRWVQRTRIDKLMKLWKFYRRSLAGILRSALEERGILLFFSGIMAVLGVCVFFMLENPLSATLDQALALTAVLIVSYILAVVVVFHIWKRIDRRVEFDGAYVPALFLTALTPLLGLSLGYSLWNYQWQGGLAGYIIGFFGFSFLGAVFTCQDNLWQKAARAFQR